jgi:hypothetical protein
MNRENMEILSKNILSKTEIRAYIKVFPFSCSLHISTFNEPNNGCVPTLLDVRSLKMGDLKWPRENQDHENSEQNFHITVANLNCQRT